MQETDLVDKNLILAVSGGVDSVVLLDIFADQTMRADLKLKKIIVAHVDHGMRVGDSKKDAEFVENLAKKYGLDFRKTELNLGPGASEETARNLRYQFLRQLARSEHALIVTAHHLDDLVETVAINIHRGTGWRGLAVFGAQDIFRPLLNTPKTEIMRYAVKNNLHWRTDQTNFSIDYLRNNFRQKVLKLDLKQKMQIYGLWAAQINKTKQIKSAIIKLRPHFQIADNKFSRYFLTMIDDKTGLEILRFLLEEQQIFQTRPQIYKILQAIRVQPVGSRLSVTKNIFIKFEKKYFLIEKRAR